METLGDYLDALASSAPTPGGGSAATIVVATAAALVAMVARITLASPRHAESAAEARAIVDAADGLRERAIAARASDERAYGDVVAALALPREPNGGAEARRERVQSALAGAALAPLRAGAIACDVLALARRAAPLQNRHLQSDVLCAVAFAGAGLEACAANVRVNHAMMRDAALVGRQEHELAELETRGATDAARARETIAAATN